jgi:hypothetical protein
VTGTLAAANGGTGQAAATADGSLIGDGAAFVVRVIPDCDTTGAALNFDQTTDAWACATQFAGTQIDLTTEVTGTLPAGNGGTGQTAATADAVLVANGTAYVARVVPDCNSAGDALNFDQTTDAWSCLNQFGSSIDPADLDAIDAPADEECLTYESASAQFEWQACGSGGASADFFTRYVSNSNIYVAACVNGCEQGGGASLVLGANEIYAVPIWFDTALTIDQLVFVVTVAGGAGEDARVGIYDDSGVFPNALEVDCGTIAVDSTGTKTVTCAGTSLAAGLHWIAIVTESATAAPNVLNSQAYVNATILGHPQANVNRTQWGWSDGHTCGAGCVDALPDPFPSASPTLLNTTSNGRPIWIAVSPQ